MSDLEQSDLENISDDEVSLGSQEDTQPTFTTKKIPQTLKVKNFDEEGNNSSADSVQSIDSGELGGGGRKTRRKISKKSRPPSSTKTFSLSTPAKMA